MRPPADLRAVLALALALAAPLAAQSAASAPAASAPASAGVKTTLPAAGAGQAALPSGEIYRREVFAYQRGGRPDPFQALLTAADLGFRVEDLRLTAIVYSPDGPRSVAVFTEGDTARRYRLHQGQRLGTMTVLRIWPQRVDVRVDEFGGSRLVTIPLLRAQRIEQAAEAAGGAAPAAAAPSITFTPNAPQQPQAPRVLRRGGAAPAAAPPTAPAGVSPPASGSVQPRVTPYTSGGARPR